MKSPSLTSFLDSLTRETREEAVARRRPSLVRSSVRPLKEVLCEMILSGQAQIEPAARTRLALYVEGVRHAFDELEQSIILYGASDSGARRYSAHAKAVAKKAHERINSTRKLLNNRFNSSNPLAEELKSDCGVGKNLKVTSPLSVLDMGEQQLKALRDKRFHALMESRDIDHARITRQLNDLLTELRLEIFGANGLTPTRGEARMSVQDNLLMLEIALDRARFFLGEYGASAVADALERRIPKRNYAKPNSKTGKNGESSKAGESASKAGGSTSTAGESTKPAENAQPSESSSPAETSEVCAEPEQQKSA